MSSQTPQLPCSREQVAEASVWMAVLRAPERDTRVERGFHRWLTAHPGNAAAFEAVSQSWEETGGLPRVPLQVARGPWLSGRTPRIVAVAATLLVLLGGALAYYMHRPGTETEIGEQRTLTLPDGSRIFLNTASRVVVNYDETTRHVVLDQGEALFDVARDKTRPFIVIALGHQIRALGTSFDVREDAHQLSVTLIDGSVAVTDPRNAASTASSSLETNTPPVDVPIILTAGERLTIAAVNPSPRIDEPSVDKITAWRLGQVDLANLQLADAAAEMNRYSNTKVVIEDPRTAAIRITGVFRAGDNASFANAIADTYDLRVKPSTGRIVIVGSPRE